MEILHALRVNLVGTFEFAVRLSTKTRRMAIWGLCGTVVPFATNQMSAAEFDEKSDFGLGPAERARPKELRAGRIV